MDSYVSLFELKLSIIVNIADDIQHASMLKDANEAGIAAPAALNGTISGPGERELEGEGWIDRQRRR